MLIFSFAISKAQLEVVINEIYPSPSSGNHEYIELYNTTGSAINLDCYTLVAYSTVGSGSAWVFQLPDVTLDPFGHYVFASGLPILFQNGSYNGSNAYNWNTAGPDGTASLTYYTRSGNALTGGVDSTTNDLIPITGGPTENMALMLFSPDGTLMNGFFANSNELVPTSITTLSALSIPVSGTCTTPISLDFQGISAPEAEVFKLTQTTGNDNGYYREKDGLCGSWKKSANPGSLSPGESNGEPLNVETLVLTSAIGSCGEYITTFDVGITVTDATLLPANYSIYIDMDFSGNLSAADSLVTSGQITTTTQVTINDVGILNNHTMIIQVTTAAGCIQVRRNFDLFCSTLPVVLKTFTAVRSQSNVNLKWETATEENNKGFYIQRRIGAGTWQTVGYVTSQAVDGNSSLPLFYQYSELNSVKAISQYRLMQVDLDAKITFSSIRAVRGLEQKGKTIVFPNPSMDGKVNVVFEDMNATRDVTLMDMNGRTLKQWKGVTNNNLQIDNLNTGFYTIRIVNTATNEQIVEKIVVNKQ